jgi:hypothetical protein
MALYSHRFGDVLRHDRVLTDREVGEFQEIHRKAIMSARRSGWRLSESNHVEWGLELVKAVMDANDARKARDAAPLTVATAEFLKVAKDRRIDGGTRGGPTATLNARSA